MLLLPFLIAGVLISQDAKVTPHMSKDLAECPGKEGLMITVVSPPGASDPIHRHNECLYEAPGNNPPHKSHQGSGFFLKAGAARRCRSVSRQPRGTRLFVGAPISL
jgi:quercetin dioxygenase-like cupin family protein